VVQQNKFLWYGHVLWKEDNGWVITCQMGSHSVTCHQQRWFSRLYRGIHQYSFYHPAEGGRLSRPRHCSKGAQPMPKAAYRSGCCDKHKATVGFDPGT